jgi:hypothetical protein
MEASFSSSSSSTMYDVPTLLGSFPNPLVMVANHGSWIPITKIVMVIAIWNLVMLSSVCVRRGNYKSVLSARQILLCVWRPERDQTNCTMNWPPKDDRQIPLPGDLWKVPGRLRWPLKGTRPPV